MCLYPRFLKNKKYQPTKKNKGIVPQCNDKRVTYVAVGCGNCIECMKKKQREWQVRLQEEIRTKNECSFVTLTFSEDSLTKIKSKLPGITGMDNEIAIYAVRHFLENWRKKYKKSIKHWLITELGHTGTERIHLHGILWSTDHKAIEHFWSYGWVYIGDYVNNKTINYIIKYVTKQTPGQKHYKPVILCSPGIGKNYLNREDSKRHYFNDEVNGKTNELYVTRDGSKLPLPIYYRNKLYTEEEREALWIQKLNEETRYVCGEKIDISKNEKEYEAVRDFYRKKNKLLGYGDLGKDYNEKVYKNHCRRIKTITKRSKSKK